MSYEFFEKRFLAYKDYFAHYTDAPASGATPDAGPESPANRPKE